jgi:hypothetical protein
LLPFFNFSGLACVVACLPGAAGAFAFGGEVVVDVDEDVDDDDSCLGMIISSVVRRAFTGASEFCS